jgi:lycopene cyclase domain-containing protein
VERFQYLLLMAGCLVGTLPLEFVYDARVWRRPGRLLATLAIPVTLFTVADVVAIDAGLWSFDPRWTTGWTLPFDVPVEEVAFFFVVPICAILAYEAVRRTLEGR